MRIIFMGTPDFAVPCLLRLLADGEQVVGVFTQPDKPKGRGYTLTPPPVKTAALEHGVPVFQPSTLRDGEAEKIIRSLAPDLIVVVAYGKILPKEILYYPKYHSVNIHASLLPKYRGAAPIQWSILRGETETGVTSMLMDEGIDTGDMLLHKTTKIEENMTAGELHDVLAELGAQVLSETVSALKNGTLRPVPQTGESSYAPMLTKALCPLDFSKSARVVHNQIRGLSPYPAATFLLSGKRIKAFQSKLGGTAEKAFPTGTVTSCDGDIAVACGDGNLVHITELQPEGKKRMSASAFLVGHKLPVGTILE